MCLIAISLTTNWPLHCTLEEFSFQTAAHHPQWPITHLTEINQLGISSEFRNFVHVIVPLDRYLSFIYLRWASFCAWGSSNWWSADLSRGALLHLAYITYLFYSCCLLCFLCSFDLFVFCINSLSNKLYKSNNLLFKKYSDLYNIFIGRPMDTLFAL